MFQQQLNRRPLCRSSSESNFMRFDQNDYHFHQDHQRQVHDFQRRLAQDPAPAPTPLPQQPLSPHQVHNFQHFAPAPAPAPLPQQPLSPHQVHDFQHFAPAPTPASLPQQPSSPQSSTRYFVIIVVSLIFVLGLWSPGPTATRQTQDEDVAFDSEMDTDTDSQRTAPWLKLGTDTAQWFVQQLRAIGVRSPKELEEKKRDIGNVEFNQFFQKSSTQKFKLQLEKAEPFFKEYLSQRGFSKKDIAELISQLNYLDAGSSEKKVFKFFVENGGNFEVTYVALMMQDKTVYIAFTSSEFEFTLSPVYTGWWLFAKKEYKSLTAEEQVKMDSFLLYQSLKSFYGSMQVDLNQLPSDDQKFFITEA